LEHFFAWTLELVAWWVKRNRKTTTLKVITGLVRRQERLISTVWGERQAGS
jgi:hypothetical protein